MYNRYRSGQKLAHVQVPVRRPLRKSSNDKINLLNTSIHCCHRYNMLYLYLWLELILSRSNFCVLNTIIGTQFGCIMDRTFTRTLHICCQTSARFSDSKMTEIISPAVVHSWTTLIFISVKSVQLCDSKIGQEKDWTHYTNHLRANAKKQAKKQLLCERPRVNKIIRKTSGGSTIACHLLPTLQG